ncbi:hypothetical protein N7488_005243 [Penicillium malachiteum]|nr:hypothetical protein N7488_005243 [Penicillium malachiteum]
MWCPEGSLFSNSTVSRPKHSKLVSHPIRHGNQKQHTDRKPGRPAALEIHSQKFIQSVLALLLGGFLHHDCLGLERHKTPVNSMREVGNTDDCGDGVQICGEGSDSTDAAITEPAPECRASGVGETKEKVRDERQPDNRQADRANVVPPAWKYGMAGFE